MCLPVAAGVVKGTVLLGMLVVIVLLGTTLMSLFDVWHVLQVGWVPPYSMAYLTRWHGYLWWRIWRWVCWWWLVSGGFC